MSNYPNVVKGLLYKKNYSVTKHIYYSGETKTYGYPLCVFFKDGDAEDNQFPFTTEKRSDQSAIDSSKALFLSEEDAEKWPEGDYAFLAKEEITAVRIDIDSKTPIYANITWVQSYINRKEESFINPVIIERMKEAPQPNPFTSVQQAKLDAKKGVKEEFKEWFKSQYPKALIWDDWISIKMKDFAPGTHIQSRVNEDRDVSFKLLSNKVKVMIKDDLYISDSEFFLSDDLFDKLIQIKKNKHRDGLESALNNDVTRVEWHIHAGEGTLFIRDRGWNKLLRDEGYFISTLMRISDINDKPKREIKYSFERGIDDITFSYKEAKSIIPKLIEALKIIFQNDFKSDSFKDFERKLKLFEIPTLDEKIHLDKEHITDKLWNDSPSNASVKKEDVKTFSDYLLNTYEAELRTDDLNSILQDLRENENEIENKLKINSLSFSFLYCCFKEWDIDLFDYDLSDWVDMLYLDCCPKEGYFLFPKKFTDKYSEIYIRVPGNSSYFSYSSKSIKIYLEEGIKNIDNITFSTERGGKIYLYLPDSLDYFELLNLKDAEDTYCLFNPVKDKDGNLTSRFTVNKWEIEDNKYDNKFVIKKRK